MSRYSSWGFSKLTRFWFVPSECQWNPIHVNRKTGLHNHILRSLICNSCFPILPKLAINIVKSWPSNCYCFVTTCPNVSIKCSIDNHQLVAKNPATSLFFCAAPKTKMTGIAQKVELFDSRQKSNSFSSIKQSLTFSIKNRIDNVTFVEKKSNEKSSILILILEVLHTGNSEERFLYG